MNQLCDNGIDCLTARMCGWSTPEGATQASDTSISAPTPAQSVPPTISSPDEYDPSAPQTAQSKPFVSTAMAPSQPV